MNSEKDLKSKTKFNFIIIYIIGFIISIFFEFYWISYYPYDYFMLFGIGIIMCIFGYLSIDGILDIVRVSARKREEQNEIMIKASKAIYLTTKKIALSASSAPEHTPAASKDLNSLIDDLTKANDRLAKEVESAVSIHSLVQENRTLADNVRKAVNDADVPSLSPLDIEKEMKLDENINETDFETAAQAEAIDSIISQEISAAEEIPKPVPEAENASETAAELPADDDILPEAVSESPASADKALTPDEIADLFANL